MRGAEIDIDSLRKRRLSDALKELETQLWGDASEGSSLRRAEAHALLTAINCLADLLLAHSKD